jgi:hypothetical protein
VPGSSYPRLQPREVYLTNWLIALGRAAADPTPARIQTTWPEFVTWLYQHPRQQSALTVDEYLYLKGFPSKSPEGQRIAADKDGPYVVLADFNGGRRAYDTLCYSTGVPLDFDAGWITADTIAATLTGYTYVAFTTYAHRPGSERWRVFVPTSGPMNADTHSATWYALSSLFANSADGAAKDATRLSYLPGKCLVPDAARIFHADGALFNPVPAAPTAPETLQAQGNGPRPGWAGPTDDETLVAIACSKRYRPDERFGGPVHFNMLWHAVPEWLAQRFPGSNGQPWDYTMADMALAGELIFFTGGDVERSVALLERSGLATVRDGDDDWHNRKARMAVERAAANAKQYAFMTDAPPPGNSVPTSAQVAPNVPEPPLEVAIMVDGVPVTPPPPASTSAEAALANANPAVINDYWAYLPDGDFIHRPSGEHHPATTVDLLIGKDARIALVPSRPVHRMTWAPGFPERFQVKDMDATDFKASECWLYNRYQPPRPADKPGDVTLWLELIARLYPDDVDHIVNYCADAVQFPQHKCNHALVLGSGVHGIGKDTLLAPLRHAVGHRNFAIIKPSDLVDSTNPWVASRVVQISESRDMGDSGFTGITRYEMYERCKDLAAAPPATLLCNDKYIRKHQVLNVLRLVVTTNHGVDGLYIDPEDRRHYCAWSDAEKMSEDEGTAIWEWYNAGGLDYVANYLATLDLTARGWNRSARPAQTAWWHQLVEGGRPAEDNRFNDAVEKLGKPQWITTHMVAEAGGLELAGWMTQPGNRRKVERELERAGYRRFPNPHEARGRWFLQGTRTAVYRRKDVPAAKLASAFGL